MPNAFGKAKVPTILPSVATEDYSNEEGCKVVNLTSAGKLKSLIDKGELNSIRKLVIRGENVGLKDLDFIAKMPALEVLDISGTNGIYTSDSKGRYSSTYTGKTITNIKEFITKSSRGIERNSADFKNRLEADAKQLSYLPDAIKNEANEVNNYVRLFPNLERLSLRGGAVLRLSFAVPSKMYVLNLGDWRGAVTKDGSILYEKKSASTDFKGYHIITSRLLKDGETGDLSEAIYIGMQTFWGDRGMGKVVIPKNIKIIDYEGFHSANEVEFEESDELLYIGQSAFAGVKNKEVIFNRPVYIERCAFRSCCPDLVVFNKDVEYIGEWAFGDRKGVKKIVFKKVPKKLANGYYDKFIYERSDYPRENYDEINVPAGTENAFVALGIPREKIYSEGGGTLALSIQLEKPNSILSVLSPDKLSKVDSLTITGFMYETDLKILEDCKNMRYLDLSKTYITYSPEKMKEQRAEKEYLAALFSFMGEAADAKFNNYEMGVLDHAYVKGFAKLMEQSYSVKEADDGCIIPTYAMCNMMKLETLILPTRTSRIGGQTFKNCKALKNVKLPPYLHTIGNGAFFGCESLESIDFPASLTSIGRAHTDGVLEGEGSFMKTGLKKIDLSKCKFDGNYNRNMWYFRLKECPTQEIHFPSGVERIHFEARQNKNSITIYVPSTTTFLDIEVNVPVTVHFASPTPPKYNTYKIPENSTVYVPKGSMTAYYSVYGNSNKYIEE